MAKKETKSTHAILGVKKGEEQWSGNIPSIAKLIGVNPETIRRWQREKKYFMYKNGFEVTFKFKRLKHE